MSSSTNLKAIIIPGNGCENVSQSVFYSYLKTHLSHLFPSGITLRDFPDPDIARESVWIPFLVDELKADENTVLIGHSSGASCAMRYLENHKAFGVVLISAALTDQGIENERLSGYYSRPWLFDSMKSNAQFILQFSSEDDHLVPVSEQRTVANKLGDACQYVEFKDKGHFLMKEVPELVEGIEKKAKEVLQK